MSQTTTAGAAASVQEHTTNGSARGSASANGSASADSLPLVPSMTMRDRAMLIGVSRSRFWMGTLTDRDETRDLAERKSVAAGRVRVRKHLFQKDALKEISEAWGAIHREWERVTLPWDEDGYRVVPTTEVIALTERLRVLIDTDLARARSSFIANYEEHKRKAALPRSQGGIGDLFNPDDYPTEQELSRYWRIHVDVRPVPYDWRTDFPPEIRERFEKRAKRRVERMMQQSLKDPFRRIHDTVSALADAIRRYEDRMGSGKARLHSSTVRDNLAELVEILPVLNIADDPLLTSMTRALREDVLKIPVARQDPETGTRSVSRVALSPDVVKHSPAARKYLLSAADQITNHLSGYLS